jgi:predicted NBD/HSP70 family sugar kinase
MRRVSIRDLSAESIRKGVSANEVLGVTSKGALVGVLVPLTAAILQQLALKDIDELMAKATDVDLTGESRAELRDTLNEAEQAGGAATEALPRVSIRDISGARLESASSAGTPLVVTSDRAVLAIFLPLQPAWVDRAVEDNVSRFLKGKSDSGADAGPIEQGETAGRAEWIRGSRQRFSREWAIGIRIVGDSRTRGERIVGVATDGLGKVKAGPRAIPLEQLEEAYVFEQILRLIERLSSDMANAGDLIGVGIEIGGHVTQGTIVRSANIHWNQFPLAEHLSEVIGVPVVLENDANALAIHEQMQGVSAKNFAVVLLTNLGVGCGLILDGRLYRGSHGMAGEIGHIPLGSVSLSKQDKDMKTEGQRCRCGNYDCLECTATPHAIDLLLKSRGFEEGYEAALRQSDNAIVRGVFADAGSSLGRGLATVLNLLDPKTIVVYGPMDLVGPPRQFHIDNFERVAEATEVKGAQRVYTDAMVESIRCHAFSSAAEECHFIVRIRGDEQGGMAAAAGVIRAVRDRRLSGADGASQYTWSK